MDPPLQAYDNGSLGRVMRMSISRGTSGRSSVLSRSKKPGILHDPPVHITCSST